MGVSAVKESPKWTPGPWVVMPEEVDRDYIRVRGGRLGGRYKIANVLTPVYPGVTDDEAQETRANARLIAVAPTMYEALLPFARLGDDLTENQCHRGISGPDKCGRCSKILAARAALKLALGEE